MPCMSPLITRSRAFIPGPNRHRCRFLVSACRDFSRITRNCNRQNVSAPSTLPRENGFDAKALVREKLWAGTPTSGYSVGFLETEPRSSVIACGVAANHLYELAIPSWLAFKVRGSRQAAEIAAAAGIA